MSEEVWRPVPGFEGHYEISNKRQIRSLDRRIEIGGRSPNSRKLVGQLIKTQCTPDGNEFVGLRRDGKHFHLSINKLMRAVFSKGA